MNEKKPYKQDAYIEAVELRRRGFTYTEIAKICNVSRGTVSNWLKNEAFSKKIAAENIKKAVKENTRRLGLINKARLSERKHRFEEVIRIAEIEFKNYKHSPLFISGLMLYLSEGDLKNSRQIRISSSRTELHRIFIDFAINYLAVEKSSVHFWLLLHPDHDVASCMRLWSRKTTLSPAQFYKNQVIQGYTQVKPLHFGVGNTIIGNTLLKKKLNHWIFLLNKELKIK